MYKLRPERVTDKEVNRHNMREPARQCDVTSVLETFVFVKNSLIIFAALIRLIRYEYKHSHDDTPWEIRRGWDDNTEVDIIEIVLEI
jgi:hypothetical protein